ncbi:hypothetical protein MLD38_009859 [Melastoma candidum]|uniref:Uncharacterized protein n=1 Tax=Melastoma candidum TaxID=119954 RepID=A0ACB9S063_9MYRT|nr:hypothetical protein MLD38_009859 [Melastoma candidum]
MRTGICAIQQTLTPESAAVVKQAVTLARRRGHAQVTPLHVASVLLASPTGLLRSSCLSSHSHPLQCKALELCFNVALNRLPGAASSGPILGGPHLSPSHPTSLSNALIAAFKRAQAHQRRGSVESQQQPILALKIELEQLVISILDDPSVSRVMREAGFSSSHVKSRVEQAVSIEVVSCDPARPKKTPIEPLRLARAKSDEEVSSADDASTIIESILGKKRNTVVIGESVASSDKVVRSAIDKLESKSSVQFLSFPVLSMRNLSRDETERKLSEFRVLMRSVYAGRSVVLYLGDIEGISEFWLNHVENRRGYHFCSLENVVMEIKKWCCGGLIAESKRVWVVGVATSSSYIKCKGGQPSLESVWELHPITLPSCSLSLTLSFSPLQAEARREAKRSMSKWMLLGHRGDESDSKKPAACCDDCILNFNKEGQVMSAACTMGISSTVAANGLPSWLQRYKDEKAGDPLESQVGAVNFKNICKKWSSFCSAFHRDSSLQYPDKLLKFSSAHASPMTSSPSSNFPRDHLAWPQLSKEEEAEIDDHQDNSPYETKPELLSNPNSSPNSASSSEIMVDLEDYCPGFAKHTSENVKMLTNALESMVPWQRDAIPLFVDTILRCRSRKSREATWMTFSGTDSIGMEKVARELGKTVYGSHAFFVSVAASLENITELPSRKRAREEIVESDYLHRFAEAVNENPHRVFFLVGFDQADNVSKHGITRAMQTGKLSVGNEESVSLQDAIIIIINNDGHDSIQSGGSPKRRQVSEDKEEGEFLEEDEANEGDPNEKTNQTTITCGMLDLNVAIEDDLNDEDNNPEGGIMDLVDGKFIFNIQEV